MMFKRRCSVRSCCKTNCESVLKISMRRVEDAPVDDPDDVGEEGERTVWVQAKGDFVASNEGQLSVRTGMVFEITSESGHGWGWAVTSDGSGWVPISFLVEVDPPGA